MQEIKKITAIFLHLETVACHFNSLKWLPLKVDAQNPNLLFVYVRTHRAQRKVGRVLNPCLATLPQNLQRHRW